MMIGYRLTSSSGTDYTPLFDEELGDVLEQFPPSFAPVNQIEPLLGATNQFAEPRGNIRCSFTLNVTMTYASADDALRSIRTPWSELLNAKFHLKVTQGEEEQYYPNAVATGYSPAWFGLTVIHSMSFSTDTVTSTVPT
jgi:hypothetical protein